MDLHSSSEIVTSSTNCVIGGCFRYNKESFVTVKIYFSKFPSRFRLDKLPTRIAFSSCPSLVFTEFLRSVITEGLFIELLLLSLEESLILSMGACAVGLTGETGGGGKGGLGDWEAGFCSPNFTGFGGVGGGFTAFEVRETGSSETLSFVTATAEALSPAADSAKSRLRRFGGFGGGTGLVGVGTSDDETVVLIFQQFSHQFLGSDLDMAL
jgi:hypothetical protein